MSKAFVWFYLIAFVVTAACTALIRVHLAFGFLGLFGPAFAAVIVTAVTEGKAGVRLLFDKLRLWRVGPGWFAVVILVTEAVSLIGVSLTLLFGAPNGIKHLPIDGIKVALFITVVGEEIGWRGYALPRLMDRYRALPASVMVGLLWGVWHLPTFFIQGTAQSHFPFPAYLLYTVSLSVLFTWFYFRTLGSVLFAWFLHGCVNTFLFWNTAADPVLMNWVQAVAYAAVALVVVVFAGPPFKKR